MEKTTITTPKAVGIKNSEVPQAIKQSVEMSFDYFKKAYGAETARLMIDTLSEEFMKTLDDYKPLQTANSAFIKKLEKDPAVLNGLYSNLKVYGSINKPDAKSSVEPGVKEVADEAPSSPVEKKESAI